VRFMPDRTVEIFRELAALESVEMSSKAKEEGTEVSSENTSVAVSRNMPHGSVAIWDRYAKGPHRRRREGVVQGVSR